LERNLGTLAERRIGPREALRLLVEEIVHSSVREKVASVGSSVLGLCIPRRSAEEFLRTGHFTMLATQPNEDAVAFTYFEPGYSELRQFGPTVVCGEFALTDVKTETDTVRDYQSSEARILHMPAPKPEELPPAASGP
jgi:hypothetical protein